MDFYEAEKIEAKFLVQIIVGSFSENMIIGNRLVIASYQCPDMFLQRAVEKLLTVKHQLCTNYI